jgi:nucleoside-diphosphate-sugar epimerase
MSDVLIVGCGYLGWRLARRWLGQGRRVLATTRSPARADVLRRAGLVPVVCDVTEPETLQALPQAHTAVVCVGYDRSAGKSQREVSVRGLENLLYRLPEPERLVHVSSTGVYGQTGGEEVDETAATDPAEESGRVVLAAESALWLRRPDAVVLRFAGIYGPGRLIRAAALRAGEPLAADPDGWLNLVHVDDGAEAVLAAAGRGEPGTTYNVCDDHPVRRRDFFGHLAALLGAPPPRYAPPAGPHAQANRRVVNGRLRRELGVSLRYPDYRAGLAASLAP